MNYISFHAILIAICFTIISIIPGGNSGEIIESERITNWGQWGAFQRCPNGTVAQAFRLRTEPYKGTLIDDTASNALELYCGNPANPNTTVISSREGHWGTWGALHRCREGGYIHGFQLRVEEQFAVPDDETATVNFRFYCTNDEPNIFVEGDGINGFGTWRSIRKCARTEGICGLQTQVEQDQGVLVDDTALNNIAVECCDLSSIYK